MKKLFITLTVLTIFILSGLAAQAEILQETLKKIEIDSTGQGFAITIRVIQDDETGLITQVKHRGPITSAEVISFMKKKEAARVATELNNEQ